jgi:serine protease AprX
MLSTTAASSAPAARQLAWWAHPDSGDMRSLSNLLRESGATVVRRIPVAHSVVIETPDSWTAPTTVSTTQDRRLRVAGTDDHSARTPETSSRGRDDVPAPGGSGGAGVTVALVDTGVASVSDLSGAVEHVNVSGAPSGDGYGHGTFLAGIIAGSGVSSAGLFPGVAPRADILDVQVAEADGSTSLLRVLAGLQVVAERARRDDSLRVVNLSLSAENPGALGMDPLSRAVESLWNRGLVVVVSAGNDGPDEGTVSWPGTDHAVITVGALDDQGTETRADDAVAGFSSRGTSNDPNAKPDLVAPGVKIVGLRAPGSVIDSLYPVGRVGAANFRGSGTSAATARTSGAVADLLSSRPDLDPDEVKLSLVTGAYAVPGGRSAAGAGGLDLAGAALAADGLATDRAAWVTGTVSAAYLRFAAAWRDGSGPAPAAAWMQLPASLRARMAMAWAAAVAADGRVSAIQSDTARAWAADADHGVAWLSRSWASRSWASRSWASRFWASRSWASRSWASSGWASQPWASRSWAADDWASRSWASRSWASRSWASRSWAIDAWGPVST